MVDKPSSRKNLIASLAVWLLILLYIGLFSWQSVARHQAFATNAYDMGNVNQAFWNTVHGRPLQFTNWRGVELDLANDSRLAMHVEPIYFVLAPIYWLWQQPETILILQTIILALGALPVFWLARDRLRSHLAGVAFAAVYLLSPGLEAANMWEFHLVALAAPLLLFAFYFGQKGRWFLLWLFAVVAMATKEEVSLSVLVMGFGFAICGPRPGAAGPPTPPQHPCLAASRSRHPARDPRRGADAGRRGLVRRGSLRDCSALRGLALALPQLL